MGLNSVASQYHKTRLCPFYLTGNCHKSNRCSYAHGSDELKPMPDLHKTKMCDAFQRGQCVDLHCRFAHGRHELRGTDQFYKTRLCHFWEKGDCNRGNLCRHAHGYHELNTKVDEIVAEQLRGLENPIRSKQAPKALPTPGNPTPPREANHRKNHKKNRGNNGPQVPHVPRVPSPPPPPGCVPASFFGDQAPTRPPQGAWPSSSSGAQPGHFFTPRKHSVRPGATPELWRCRNDQSYALAISKLSDMLESKEEKTEPKGPSAVRSGLVPWTRDTNYLSHQRQYSGGPQNEQHQIVGQPHAGSEFSLASGLSMRQGVEYGATDYGAEGNRYSGKDVNYGRTGEDPNFAGPITNYYSIDYNNYAAGINHGSKDYHGATGFNHYGGNNANYSDYRGAKDTDTHYFPVEVDLFPVKETDMFPVKETDIFPVKETDAFPESDVDYFGVQEIDFFGVNDDVDYFGVNDIDYFGVKDSTTHGSNDTPTYGAIDINLYGAPDSTTDTMNYGSNDFINCNTNAITDLGAEEINYFGANDTINYDAKEITTVAKDVNTTVARFPGSPTLSALASTMASPQTSMRSNTSYQNFFAQNFSEEAEGMQPILEFVDHYAGFQ